jgi:hypothetical protein
MRNTVVAYASSSSTDVVAYEDLPGHHLLAVGNLIATTNDESYHRSANELPPTTSHGYAEWDFSGVPDLVMFRRFLDATDYWFDCSDDSSHVSALWWLSMTRPTARTWRGLATEKPPKTQAERTLEPWAKHTSHLAYGRREHQCAAGSSARARG